MSLILEGGDASYALANIDKTVFCDDFKQMIFTETVSLGEMFGKISILMCLVITGYFKQSIIMNKSVQERIFCFFKCREGIEGL